LKFIHFAEMRLFANMLHIVGEWRIFRRNVNRELFKDCFISTCRQ